MGKDKQVLLRAIPAIDALVRDERVTAWISRLGRKVVVAALRAAADAVRADLVAGAADLREAQTLRAAVLERAAHMLSASEKPFYCRAINATGIILHTGLGRAVLAKRAMAQIAAHLDGYSVLQLEPESGKRGKRDGRIEELLTRLTGAEAATLVNNNAAATLLVLNTIGAGREVIVSRGQLVEIGGSFRLPEVMAASGARLVEVGTTNRTHPRDYEKAINENTAAILRVHPSNYRIEGFASEVPLETLIKIAHERGIVLIDDVGAGALVDFSRFGFRKEPTLPESVAAGSDIITASADKLIGASQGGVILGKRDLIERVRKNPLWRVVRVGKMTLAAAEATLSLFLDESLAMRELPTLRMATRPLAAISREAGRIARALKPAAGRAGIAVEDGTSEMGSGSLPGQGIPTKVVSVRPSAMSVDEVALKLRQADPPIFARIHQGALLIDPRTLQAGEARIVAETLIAILKAGS